MSELKSIQFYYEFENRVGKFNLFFQLFSSFSLAPLLNRQRDLFFKWKVKKCVHQRKQNLSYVTDILLRYHIVIFLQVIASDKTMWKTSNFRRQT